MKGCTAARKQNCRRTRSRARRRFLEASVAEALKAGEAHVGESAEVETIRLSPGVLEVGVFGAVERVAGRSGGFCGVSSAPRGWEPALLEVWTKKVWGVEMK